MEEIKITGGLKIGGFSITYPFATLISNSSQLSIHTSMKGEYFFQASDIISLEVYNANFLRKGIVIKHSVTNYDKEILFRTMEAPEIVKQNILKSGFLVGKADEEKILDIVQKQQRTGNIIKTNFILGMFMLCLLLLLFGLVLDTPTISTIEMFYYLTVGVVFVNALLLAFSSGYRKVVFVAGREPYRVQRDALFLVFLCGLLLICLV